MRRPLAAVALTAVLLWLILTYKSSPLPPATSLNAAARATSTSTPEPAATTPATTLPRVTAPPIQRTVTGNDVPNRYGDVQVALVLNGSRIVDVKAIQLPFDRPRSKDISDQAAPWLRAEVLKAQSAQIDTVGGATYTSESYATSVQSALDKARG